eukprot:TRINITY_DN11069_c0_g1_i3.p1 TRINITY_DN11069_c0_g1~~TRINITY_DN11069_c0_g1_i3.p1  ORF type:complete len:230 (+),score=46.15 TRINITY_DN11069_c0_g1_i3:65-754(+)
MCIRDRIKEVERTKTNMRRRLDDEKENKVESLSVRRMPDYEWTQVMDRIRRGAATNNDLYLLAIEEGGSRDGRLTPEDFAMVVKRMGTPLTRHRLTEIMASVKGSKNARNKNITLSVKEFEKALEYLNEKNSYLGMVFLGISRETLALIVLGLSLLLILLFIFIFLGISAFTHGDGFTAIINSGIIVGAGGAVGKEKESIDEKLNDEDVNGAVGDAQEVLYASGNGSEQ